MKKITFITMQLKTPGGIERFVCTLAKILSKKYEVEIVANYGKKGETLAFPIPENVKLTFLSPRQPKEISLKEILLNFQWNKIIGELKRRHGINKNQKYVFKKYLSTLQTDYIVTERAKYNFLVSKFYRGNAKKIATDHNYHQNSPKYINQLIKSLYNFDALVVATKELQNFYQPYLKNLKCYYIPNPLPEIPSKKSRLNTKNIISIGRFVPEKDFTSLIKVMAKVHTLDPNIHLTIIGDGKEMPLVKKQIKDLSLTKCISLPGFLPQSEITKYYYDSSLFAMTSRTEAFALVLSEAMSYGIPCIAFEKASGARAQISEDIGILIPNTDIDSMASHIINLLNDPQSLKKYQNNIEKYVQKLAPEAILESWGQVVH